MGMSIPYEEIGRVQQKARTRAALVGSVKELLRQGITPTVEEAAEHAGISRTTAYRYFPNQRDLLIAVYPQIDLDSLMGDNPPSGVEDRVARVLDASGRILFESGPELRTALRLSLEGGHDVTLLRRGRFIQWLEDALSPLTETHGHAEVRRLAVALRAAFGIEPMIWLTDIAGLSDEDAVGVMRDSALTLLRAAIHQPEV